MSERDAFLEELKERHYNEMNASTIMFMEKLARRNWEPLSYKDFSKLFSRLYENIDELIEYKMEKRIAEERQKVINGN